MFEDLPFRVSIKYKGEYVPFDSIPAELQEQVKANAREVVSTAIRQQIELMRIRASLNTGKKQAAGDE